MPQYAQQVAPISVPETSSVSIVSLAELESDELRHITAAWSRLKDGRLMPAREEVGPRAFGSYARNVSLIRAIEGGEDYEFRVVGDAHVQAYGASPHKYVSEVIASAPDYGTRLKLSYDYVRMSGQPLAFRGLMGRDLPDSRFVWFEAAYLPLGADGKVDHILTVAVYAPRSGTWDE